MFAAAAVACLPAHPAARAQAPAGAGGGGGIRREEQPWPESSPESLQVDPGKLATLEQLLVADHPAIRSVLIARKGAIAYEYHREGLGRESRHDVNSVTKSVVSLLVGIALGQGLIRGTDETLADFFGDEPELKANTPAQGITLAQLLTLTTGFDTSALDRDTDYADFLRRFHTDGLLGHALKRPVSHPPGTRFHYSNLDAHLVSLALARRAKASVAAYAQQHLFGPLGIVDFAWPTNLRGDSNGASGLSLRARDMARLGQLVLQQGRWNGRQVVPADYVARATRRQAASDLPVRSRPDLWGYGYLWWTVATLGDELPACYAAGYGGQFIYVVPALDLVVTATTEAQSRGNAVRTGAVIRDHVLPAVRR
jgi:CubicO group peptidase (beta-lactamase class C family)